MYFKQVSQPTNIGPRISRSERKKLEQDDKPPSPPKMKFKMIGEKGVMQIYFDQEMVHPNSILELDYGSIFEIYTIAIVDGS